MPEIIWEFLRQEYTNSEEWKVEVKATVKSSVPLKGVKLAIKKSLKEEAINSKPIGLPLVAGNYQVPIWMSWIAVLLTLALAISIWYEHRKT